MTHVKVILSIERGNVTDSGREDSAAVLVGRLIRSYRAGGRRNGKRLSQDGLLDLMVESGEEYASNLDRSSISHRERGTRVAPREFLVALGRTLKVPKGEMDSLLVLAGYDSLGDEEGRAAILAAALSIESQVETLQREVRDLIDTASPPPAFGRRYRCSEDCSIENGTAWCLCTRSRVRPQCDGLKWDSSSPGLRADSVSDRYRPSSIEVAKGGPGRFAT